MVKTTIRNIDPDVFWDAKIYAAQTQQTLGEVVTEALQVLMQDDETKEVDLPDTDVNLYS